MCCICILALGPETVRGRPPLLPDFILFRCNGFLHVVEGTAAEPLGSHLLRLGLG